MFLFSDYWAGYCTTMVCNSSHNNNWFCATPQKSSNGRGDTTRFKWGNVSKVVQVDNWNRMMTGLFPHIGYHLNHTKIYWYVCVGFACQGFKILLTDTIYRAVYNIVLCYSGLSTFSLYLLSQIQCIHSLDKYGKFIVSFFLHFGHIFKKATLFSIWSILGN